MSRGKGVTRATQNLLRATLGKYVQVKVRSDNGRSYLRMGKGKGNAFGGFRVGYASMMRGLCVCASSGEVGEWYRIVLLGVLHSCLWRVHRSRTCMDKSVDWSGTY